MDVLVDVIITTVVSSRLLTGVSDALHSDSSRSPPLGSASEAKTVSKVDGPAALGVSARAIFAA